MDVNEINALISLLDDSDEEVVIHVTEKLLSYGESVIPILEDRYLAETEKLLQAKIHEIIDIIHRTGLQTDLHHWAESGGHDLFEGYFLISRFRYPELNKQTINNQLDKIKLDAWLELNFMLSPLDKIRILNNVFYDISGFKGNIDNYHSPDNSYLNRVLETKKGNPISLAIIYSIIAQRLNMPVFGVNLPQHFILGYKDDSAMQDMSSFKGNLYLDPMMHGDVLFYVNAFNKGAIFSKWNIDNFLKQLSIKPQEMYYEPCSNIEIIMRVCRNLIFSYEKLNDTFHAQGLQNLLNILQPFSNIF